MPDVNFALILFQMCSAHMTMTKDAQQSILHDAVILIEGSGSLQVNERAKELSTKLGLQVHTIPHSSKSGPSKKRQFMQAKWQLVFRQSGLALRVADEPSWSDIQVDFEAAHLQYRKTHGGGRNEALAKAISIKGKDTLNVIDCTAGMGTDSFVMVSAGAQVTMLERSPIIAALLDDALFRANNNGLELGSVLHLLHQDAIDYFGANTASQTHTDMVYLDPMFPHKKKSALVKKEMRAFQIMLGPDLDSGQLMDSAIGFSPTRIVVKRPAIAPALANNHGLSPSMAIQSKKHRFDVYLLN